jgi:hypothetical protein
VASTREKLVRALAGAVSISSQADLSLSVSAGGVSTGAEEDASGWIGCANVEKERRGGSSEAAGREGGALIVGAGVDSDSTGARVSGVGSALGAVEGGGGGGEVEEDMR